MIDASPRWNSGPAATRYTLDSRAATDVGPANSRSLSDARTSSERDAILERYDGRSVAPRRDALNRDSGALSDRTPAPSLSRARRGMDPVVRTPQARQPAQELSSADLGQPRSSASAQREAPQRSARELASESARRDRLARTRPQDGTQTGSADATARAQTTRERALNLARARRSLDAVGATGTSPTAALGTNRSRFAGGDAAAGGTTRERVQRARRTETRLGELGNRDARAYDRVARIGQATARASSISLAVGLSVGLGYGYGSYGCGYYGPGAWSYFNCWYPGWAWNCQPYYWWPVSWYYNACFGWPLAYYWSSPAYYYNPAPYRYGTVVYNYYYDDGYAADVVEQPLAAEPAPLGPAATAAPDSAAVARDRYLELGDQAFYEGRYDDAVHYYAKAVSFADEDAMLYLVLSDALFATGDYHYGAYALRRALELDPTQATQSIDKRTFYADPSSFERQLAVLERYLADRPTDADARLLLAANYLFGAAPADALETLEGPAADDLEDEPAARAIRDAARMALAPAPAED